jgi:hypothetical protein
MKRRRRRYDRPQPGEWYAPKRLGYRLMCCDCGLVHRMDHRALRVSSAGRVLIQVRWFRDNRATAAARRGKR